MVISCQIDDDDADGDGIKNGRQHLPEQSSMIRTMRNQPFDSDKDTFPMFSMMTTITMVGLMMLNSMGSGSFENPPV